MASCARVNPRGFALPYPTTRPGAYRGRGRETTLAHHHESNAKTNYEHERPTSKMDGVLGSVLKPLLASSERTKSLGVVGRFQPGFNTGLGFDGITIALLARTSPIGVIPAALLVGAMQAGSSQMQFDADVPFQIIDVIQALILFFVSADMLVRWIVRTRADEVEQVTLSSSWGSS